MWPSPQQAAVVRRRGSWQSGEWGWGHPAECPALHGRSPHSRHSLVDAKCAARAPAGHAACATAGQNMSDSAVWKKPDAQTHPLCSTAYTLVFSSQQTGQSPACLTPCPALGCSPRACRVHEDSFQWRRTPTGSCSAVDPPRRCSPNSQSLHQHCHGTHQ